MGFKYFFLVIVLFSCVSFLKAADHQIHIYGSNTIGARLAPELAKAWLKQKGYEIRSAKQVEESIRLQAVNMSGDNIDVLFEAKGSSTGFKGLQQGVADIGMSSRRIYNKEIDSLSSLGDMRSLESEHVIALDGIAIIVHPSNPLTTLSKSQVRNIFSGKTGNWKQVGGKSAAINLYARDNQSGTYEVFNKLVMGKQAKLAVKAQRFADNAKLSQKVSTDPLGIGFVGLPYILQSKALAISDGEAPAIAPTRFSVATEDYALSRRLYLYTPSKEPSNPLVLDFIEFVHSDPAQEIIDQVGFITQQIYLSDLPPGNHYPMAMRRLAQGAKRLSLNMRFDERTVYLDNKAKRDADRVYDFLKKIEKLKNGLLLFGFVEEKPDGLPAASFNRSVRRADQVAKYLRKKGVRISTSRGYGSAAPVASNDTPIGQEKNRRVEIWLK